MTPCSPRIPLDCRSHNLVSTFMPTTVKIIPLIFNFVGITQPLGLAVSGCLLTNRSACTLERRNWNERLVS